MDQQQVQQVVVSKGDLRGRGRSAGGADWEDGGREPEPTPQDDPTVCMDLPVSTLAQKGRMLTWSPMMKALPPWFWDSRFSKGFRCPGRAFT